VRITLASCVATLLALATYLPAPGATVAESVYDRGLRLLAELLAREAFIPEPTVASLRKYFPPLTGALPGDMGEDKAAEWRDLLPYYRGLVEQHGRTGEVSPGLVRAVKVWEHLETRKASTEEWDNARKALGLPKHARWYQEAVAEWEWIQAESRGQPQKDRLSLPPDPKRRQKVEERLRAHPELQQVFDVVNAPLRPEPGAPVSVVRGTRRGPRILVEQYFVPRESFQLTQCLHAAAIDGRPAERRVRRVCRPKRSLPTPSSPPPRGQAVGELERLWSAPDPALTNHGLAVEPEYLQQRLQDPTYAQRYAQRLGSPVEPEPLEVPDAPEVPTPSSAAA
jgi:hypothetical protein